jgi:hypothetical protein
MALIVFLVAFSIYSFGLAPTITLESSGQFVVAAAHLGVARPPGYPVWHLLANAFLRLFSFAGYHGHLNPAWAVNLMSALFAALACGAMSLLLSRETRFVWTDRSSKKPPFLVPGCSVFAFAAALLFAFSQAMWSQSVIAETHALTIFYLLVFLNLLLYWMERRHERTACIMAFFFGLGLSVSPLLVLLAPVMLVAAAFVSGKALVRVAVATGLFLCFIVMEFAIGRQSPRVAAMGLGVTLGVMAVLLLPCRTRSMGFMLALMLGGLLPYIYLPLAASHNPPMNMGYACTWEGFWHVINRGQYERLSPLNPFVHSEIFLDQLRWYVRLAISQFTAPILLFSLVPAFCLPMLRARARRVVMVILVAFFMFSIITLLGTNPVLDVQTTMIARLLFIPSFAMLAILIGYGFMILMPIRLLEESA